MVTTSKDTIVGAVRDLVRQRAVIAERALAEAVDLADLLRMCKVYAADLDTGFRMMPGQPERTEFEWVSLPGFREHDQILVPGHRALTAVGNLGARVHPAVSDEAFMLSGTHELIRAVGLTMEEIQTWRLP